MSRCNLSDGKTANKPRLGAMLRGSFEKSPNRSEELDALKERYKKFNQQLNQLGKALKLRHQSLVSTGKSRAAVADALNVMTENTPVRDASLLQKSQMKIMAEKSQDRADDFKTFALDYFNEWQDKVTTRINADIKANDALRLDADHYQTKCSQLEKQVESLAAKNKPVPPATAEKLVRNQEKSRDAAKAYQDSARDLFLVMEELVDRSWRDLHPLLVKLCNFEVTISSDEKSLEEKFESAIADLKNIRSNDSEVPKSTKENRLDRLQEVTPQELGEVDGATPSKFTPTPVANYQDSSNANKNNSNSNSDAPEQAKTAPEQRNSWFNRGNSKKQQQVDSDSSSSSSDDSDDNINKGRPEEMQERKPNPYSQKNLTDSKTNPYDTSDQASSSSPTTTNDKKKNQPASERESRPASRNPFARARSKSRGRTPSGATPASSNNSNKNGDKPSRNPFNRTRSKSRGRTPSGAGTNNNDRTPSGGVARAAAPAAAAAAPSRNNGQDGVGGTSKPGGKVANNKPRRPVSEGKPDPYANSDPSKWRTDEHQFGGSFTYETKGETEEVIGTPIKKGIEKFKANPEKYVCIFYQSNMLSWPTDKQRYILVHREGTAGYTPQNLGKGPMTIYIHNYEALPPLPNDELPPSAKDRYTDNMTHQGRKLHHNDNKPMLPGRGMGVCDFPLIKIIGDVDPSDIHQGSVGDCWLLSGISSLAEFDGAVKRLFRKTPQLEQRPLPGPNMYTVTLWDLRTWTEVDIQVDESLPVMADGSRKLLASRPSEDGELWVCYLEKALAAHCGGWDKITGGQCTHAWSLLTGCKEQYTIRRNPKTNKFQCFGKFDPNTKTWLRHGNSPHEGDQVTWPMDWPKVGGGGTLRDEMTEEELFQKMCAWDAENYIVGAGCSSKKGDKGLVDNHAYSVIECLNDVAGTDIDIIKVRNPWGGGEIENGMFDDDGPGWAKYPQIKKALNPVVADDGIFWVTKQEFFVFFSTVYLCAFSMTDFLED